MVKRRPQASTTSKQKGSHAENDEIQQATDDEMNIGTLIVTEGETTDYETTADEFGSFEEDDIPNTVRPQINVEAEVHMGSSPSHPNIRQNAGLDNVRRLTPVRHVGRPGLRRKLQNTDPTEQPTPTRNSSIEAGDNSPGIYNAVKGALKEMTSQIVSAIQTAFEGFTNHQNADNASDKLENGKSSDRLARSMANQKKLRSISRYPTQPPSSSEEETEPIIRRRSSNGSVRTSEIFQPTHKGQKSSVKLPAFTGTTEKWEVWYNRFEAVARIEHWTQEEKLSEILPRLQGVAGEFTYGQLPTSVLSNYKRLLKELQSRFGEVETAKLYIMQFTRRNQQPGESAEEYAAELKRLYDKAYKNRGVSIRQEDLLRRFLLGLRDQKTRIYVELNKEPETIEDAVYHVVHYLETTRYPHNPEDSDRKEKKPTRQVNAPVKQKPVKKSVQPEEKQSAGWRSAQQKPQTGAPRTITMQEGDLQDLVNQLVDERIKSQLQTQSKERSSNSNQWPGRRNSSADTLAVRTSYDSNMQAPWRHADPQTSRANNGICFACGQNGHFARSCPQRNQQKSHNNEGRFQQSTPSTAYQQSNDIQRSGDVNLVNSSSPVLTHSSSN